MLQQPGSNTSDIQVLVSVLRPPTRFFLIPLIVHGSSEDIELGF